LRSSTDQGHSELRQRAARKRLRPRQGPRAARAGGEGARRQLREVEELEAKAGALEADAAAAEAAAGDADAAAAAHWKALGALRSEKRAARLLRAQVVAGRAARALELLARTPPGPAWALTSLLGPPSWVP